MSSVRDLAQESFSRSVAEVEQDISRQRTRLDGPLGMALINGMETSERQSAANYELVNNFVRLLPSAEDSRRTGGGPVGFTADSQSGALFLAGFNSMG